MGRSRSLTSIPSEPPVTLSIALPPGYDLSAEVMEETARRIAERRATREADPAGFEAYLALFLCHLPEVGR